MTDPIHVPDEWLLAAAIDAHNDGREALADFDGDDLEYVRDGIAAVIPLVRAEQAAEMEQLRAERSALTTLRDMIANLQTHINQRAAELAAPHIAEIGLAAGKEVADAQAGQQRAEDLVAELRRQFAALERNREHYRQRAEQAEAALTAARESRGPEIHGEPRTDPTPTRDTRPAP